VAELWPTRNLDSPAAKAAWNRLRELRDAGPMIPVTSVELLRQIYEDE
jgi:hypothetical protein